MTEQSSAVKRFVSRNLLTSKAIAAAVGVVVLVFVLPRYLSQFEIFLASGTLFVATFAVSWDFFTGLSGYFNFGHMVLVGMGGYSSVLLEAEVGIPIWGAILAATLLTGIFGTVLLAGPSLRLSGIYFAALTLIVMIWSENIIVLFSDLTGGIQGYLFVASLGQELDSALQTGLITEYLIYYVAVANFLFILGLLLLIAKSDLGKMLVAIRQNEVLLSSLGLNPTRFKITAFAITALVTGFTGALWSHSIRTLSPATQLNLTTMIDIVLASVIGGIGTIVGAALGIFVLEIIDYLLTLIHSNGIVTDTIGVDIRDFRRVIWMSLALVFMFFYPSGLYPRIKSFLNRVDERVAGEDETALDRVNEPASGGDKND